MKRRPGLVTCQRAADPAIERRPVPVIKKGFWERL
ncbi:MAG: hypothetical protein ACI8V4_003196, partial [Ilumatobacter sp.]